MKVKQYDVAVTLKITTPDTLASEYRQLGLLGGNKALADLSKEYPDDAEFTERILQDNIRHAIGKLLPTFLEEGGFGVRVVPLALQRANIEDIPSTQEIAAQDDAQGELDLEGAGYA